MVEVKPFRAVIYNQDKIEDLAKVVCPPYDVISAQKQLFYQELDAHNLIHILLRPDTEREDKYQRAAGYFKDWIKNKVFIQEEESAIYFYTQQYNIKGEKKIRFGFICLLRLDEKGASVFAHEHTRSEPKDDRLKLLRQVNANLSPIFAVFLDKKRIIQRTYQKHIRDKLPLMCVTDEDKTTHKIWKITAPSLIKEIQTSMLKEEIFIADGHHRYEVACLYRDEMQQALGTSFTGEEDFNYLMSYFTNTDPHGLLILSIHRLLKLDKHLDFETFQKKLQDFFDLEEVKKTEQFFFLLQKCGQSEHVIGMYKDKRYWLLRLKNIKILDRIMSDKPKEYRELDVSILNAIVFEKILNIDVTDKKNLTFNHDYEYIIDQVDCDRSCVGFFLNPVKMQQIISVALKGERMPSKSTFFYPKLVSGLVINKHEDR